jgi:hypothetical protein
VGRLGIKMATALAATLATAVSATGAAVAAPPTTAELERATESFLAAHPRPADSGGVAEPAPISVPALDEQRLIALYGAPQMGQTILGSRSPAGAGRKLASQSKPYIELGERPVIAAFDLVSVFATAGGGPDGLYRTRQDDQVIGIYLERARAAGARLILDVQPGRARLADEIRALREWLVEPDVDLAIDPEWIVGRRGIPGQTVGKISARQVRDAQRRLARIVAENDLPPKLLVVHQFRRGSIRGRARIRPRRGVQTVLNFDGIGSPAAKQAGYAALSPPRLFDGFSLFYRRDTPLLRPASVLGLVPEPDFLLYQ